MVARSSGVTRRTVRLWDPATGSACGELTGYTGWVGALAAIPMHDGGILLATADADRVIII